MIRLVLAVLVSEHITYVFSARDAAGSKCSGYTFKEYTGGYLKYQEMPLTFDDAKQRCTVEGGILASPINDRVKDAMLSIMKTSDVINAAFTGFSAKSNYRGIFSSVEGIRLSNIPHNWAPGEPDNCENEENCIIMLPDGTMADGKCDEPFPYFCFTKEGRAKTMNVCGANDKDYALDNSTGSCYKFHRNRLNYEDAAKACEEEGAHLLIINGEIEEQAIKKLFSMYPSSEVGNTATIGIRLFKKSGEWMTLHGETIKEAGYDKWAPGEPNDAVNTCATIYRNGMLDDISCGKTPFICEKDPEIVFCD